MSAIERNEEVILMKNRKLDATKRERSIAGVPLIDSTIAVRSTEFAREAYSPVLFNHAVRTYIFGVLIGRARKDRFEPETLYVACLLHDLGLTSQFEGDLPFEVQGAEAARVFLRNQGVPATTIETIWNGIALHTSAVGEFKAAEIALVGRGAAADTVGPQSSEISAVQIAETVAAFPRLQFKSAFLDMCAGVVERHPMGAARSFMRDVGERLVPGFRPPNFCDALKASPFAE